MKRKLKLLASSAAVAALTMPAAVLAQFQTPGNTNLPSNTIWRILENTMRWLLGIVGIIGVIGFAIAGILYLIAAGDDTKIKTAKNAMTYSIIGVVVALLGLIILTAAKSWLSGQSNF